MSRAPTLRLHRQLTTLLALLSVLAFVSGAGFAAPGLIPAAVLLLVAVIWDPSTPLRRRLEWFWRILALLLAVRASYQALFVPTDLVLPMVDLLLLLVVAETYRVHDGIGEARLLALTFALLIASAAYRPGILFAAAFIAYLAVLTVTLIVGQVNRQARLRQLRPPSLSRGFLTQSAALSGIALAVSVLVFLVFPRVSWGARAAPVPRTVVGFADRVSLLQHGSRIYANPATVLRVEFPGGAPPARDLYWRGRSYDTFDGWSWSRRTGRAHRLVEVRQWPGTRVEQVIYQSALVEANVLFGLSPLLDVRPLSRILSYREPNGDFTYGGQAEPVYAAVSILGEPPAAALRAAPAPGPGGSPVPAVLAPYLRLPPLDPRVYQLADSLTAAHATHYDRAVAVRDWLRGTFRYTVELPASAAEASLEHFLFNRRAGHCEYFSTAMAVLLRAAGVPARNVNGFLGGEWNEFGDFLTVTQNQAHSWVEVWFPAFGWVTFDPTPSSAGALAADGARGWWSPFRFFLADVEHRWGKWVLDYGLDDQSRLLSRITEPFRRVDAPAPEQPGGVPWRRLAAAALLVAVIVAAFSWRATGSARATSAGPATRAYLRLRRAYRSAGLYPAATPLAFLHQLHATSAPGLEQAERIIERYTRARFGGRVLGIVELQGLRADLRTLEGALRRSRGALPGRLQLLAGRPPARR